MSGVLRYSNVSVQCLIAHHPTAICATFKREQWSIQKRAVVHSLASYAAFSLSLILKKRMSE
ncbi:hypothetical protein [Hoylesella nanceiensis]|uniref:hypothetical protein n=1 Tax=Hoylesella nanceiensis TaxID=425941 RepID=UPI0012B6263F|nr:hypothetical protein [Hoylesella nanceiensis]